MWEEAWEPREERDEVGETLVAPIKSKRREEEGGRRKKAKLEEEGKVWGEYRSDEGVARSRFLTEGVEKVRGVTGQSRILFHSGLEWCMREILKSVADMAVETSTACSIAKGLEVWAGEQQEEEKPSKPVVAKKGKKEKTNWREQYLWKRLEEIDKEMANEEKRAEVKRERAVERARMRKGAGTN